MEVDPPEFGIAGVFIPFEMFDEGLWDYLYQKSHSDTAQYLLELLKADRDAKADTDA